MNISRQLLQAVAYLHNLKPQVLHRDIKPANVLVARETHITKLCDMGLSKLKSRQSVTHTGITTPGTPQYMAPECLLHKRKATTASDIWSVACTLVELFTGADCWEAELEEDHQNADQITALMSIMAKRQRPRCLDNLSVDVIGGLHPVLVQCFDYCEDNRPSAIDILTAVNLAV
ncbi:hypothetical protein QZH41_007608 [Actinostola sp. cb2023]|nr:hypothetical protein QZH41_007608 [Actinostola sp. cb2023]